MLIIKYKQDSSELLYSLDIVLKEFLGLDYKFEKTNINQIEIYQKNCNSKLSINSEFFIRVESNWLNKLSMPDKPLDQWNYKRDIPLDFGYPTLPVLYGKSGINKNTINHWHINIDIFGSSFFMLSRYEEVVIHIKDKHDRFPSKASLSYQENFLDRPIINEYTEVLWSCLSVLFPSLKRKNRQFRKLISCDVDHPIDKAANSVYRTLKRLGSRIIRDKNISLATTDILNFFTIKTKSRIFDSYVQNILWIMKVNKEKGNIVTFNFIPYQTNTNYEDDNNIEDNEIRNILNLIIDSGHRIGIHPGYDTYNNIKKFSQSVSKFRHALLELDLKYNTIGGRQHYLRYDVSITPSFWDQEKLNYDSSLGYAEHAGFRAGCCYEFSMYDLIQRKKLTLKQRPLIAMDCTVISKTYEGLGFTKKAHERFKYLENACEKYNGDFTLLWHNSFFNQKTSKKFYLGLIE